MYNEDTVQYYILDGFQLKPAEASSYMAQLEEGGHVLEHTIIERGVEIWTCLMGHDQRDAPSDKLAPLLFETMIVGLKNYPTDTEMTSTVGQAKNCHYRHVQSVKRYIKTRRSKGGHY